MRELEGPARAALRWISEYGDSDGYVDYIKHSPVGLENQGWKDSFNSVLYSNGALAEPPIALCEVQGYVFDAWSRTADLARRVGGMRTWPAKCELETAPLLPREFSDLRVRGVPAFGRRFDLPT